MISSTSELDLKGQHVISREWPVMEGSWIEYAVLWKTSLGIIWDLLKFLKICKSWVELFYIYDVVI